MDREQRGGWVYAHEKRLKRWRRDWKLELIEQQNPDWRDLFDELAGT